MKFNNFISGNITNRSHFVFLSTLFAKSRFKQIDAISYLPLIGKRFFSLKHCVCQLPSAIKWRIIKKVIPLITPCESVSRWSHFVAPICYWNILKSVDSADGASFNHKMWSICFDAPWKLSDSFIQYPKRLNVHLISCFGSSFTKISYNDRYETFSSVFCFSFNLTERNHVVHTTETTNVLETLKENLKWSWNYSKQSLSF